MAQTDAPAKLLIKKGVITEAGFLVPIAEDRDDELKSLIAFRSNVKSRAVTDPIPAEFVSVIRQTI